MLSELLGEVGAPELQVLELHVEDILLGEQVCAKPVSVDVVVARSEALDELEERLFGLGGGIWRPRLFGSCQHLRAVHAPYVEARHASLMVALTDSRMVREMEAMEECKEGERCW